MKISDKIKTISIAKSHLAMIHGELDAALQLYEKLDLLLENAVEIGQIAALLEKEEKIVIDDGKELSMFCVDLAKKFEEKFDPEEGDYWNEISNFATDALIKEFGPEKEPEPNFVKSVEAYNRSMHDVCYVIPTGGWKHHHLLALVQGDEALCKQMFDELNGESPREYIKEYLDNGYWTKCEACGRIFDSDMRKDPTAEIIKCPHCHTFLPGDEPYDVAVDKELGYQ